MRGSDLNTGANRTRTAGTTRNTGTTLTLAPSDDEDGDSRDAHRPAHGGTGDNQWQGNGPPLAPARPGPRLARRDGSGDLLLVVGGSGGRPVRHARRVRSRGVAGADHPPALGR